jgi:hypothetical protein
VCSIFALSLYANLSYFFKSPQQLAFFPPFIEGLNLNHNKHLGAEYYFIAQAVASGKGFSNPFQEDTGPTAWMPPGYPLLLALVIKLLKNVHLVSCCIIFLKNVVLLGTGLLIYEIAQKTSSHLKAHFALFIYVLWLVTYFRWFFQITHDGWLLLLCIDGLYGGAITLWSRTIDRTTALVWGMVGGSAVLVSPILGMVWLSITGTLYLRTRSKISVPVKGLFILSLVIGITMSSLWFIRNYRVFNRFVPIKSNLYYDAYLANYEKENGILDESFFLSNHPVWNISKAKLADYIKLGEMGFVDLYKEQFTEKLRRNPERFFRNVTNRFLAALVVYYPYNTSYERKFMIWKYVIHALPFCFIVVLLVTKKMSYYAGLALLIYSTFLIPYIVISYYIRYSIPLVPLQTLFIFWGIDLLSAKIKISFHRERR